MPSNRDAEFAGQGFGGSAIGPVTNHVQVGLRLLRLHPGDGLEQHTPSFSLHQSSDEQNRNVAFALCGCSETSVVDADEVGDDLFRWAAVPDQTLANEI